MASVRLSMPHSPHPVGPAILRRRVKNSAASGVLSQMRSSMPISSSTISTLSMASTEEITPSVRLKPMAKSSRSCGVAIITA